MFWLLALAATGLGGAYVWAKGQNPPPVDPSHLIPIHWYRVLWNVGAPMAQTGAAESQKTAKALMFAQGFTAALGALPAVEQPNGSFNVQVTGPYVAGPGTLVGGLGVTLLTVYEVRPIPPSQMPANA